MDSKNIKELYIATQEMLSGLNKMENVFGTVIKDVKLTADQQRMVNEQKEKLEKEIFNLNKNINDCNKGR